MIFRFFKLKVILKFKCHLMTMAILMEYYQNKRYTEMYYHSIEVCTMNLSLLSIYETECFINIIAKFRLLHAVNTLQSVIWMSLFLHIVYIVKT